MEWSTKYLRRWFGGCRRMCAVHLWIFELLNWKELRWLNGRWLLIAGIAGEHFTYQPMRMIVHHEQRAFMCLVTNGTLNALPWMRKRGIGDGSVIMPLVNTSIPRLQSFLVDCFEYSNKKVTLTRMKSFNAIFVLKQSIHSALNVSILTHLLIDSLFNGTI